MYIKCFHTLLFVYITISECRSDVYLHYKHIEAMATKTSENKVEIYGVGSGTKGWLEKEAQKKEISLSEFCKHILLEYKQKTESLRGSKI
jgi:predicted peroxiredoxin